MSDPNLRSNLTFEDFQKTVCRAAGVPISQVEAKSDLVGLGLDSIRLMRLAGWLRKRGLPIRFSEFSDRQTVGEWWQLISAVQDSVGLSEAMRVNGPADVDESDPFDFAVMQHAFWVGRAEG